MGILAIGGAYFGGRGSSSGSASNTQDDVKAEWVSLSKYLIHDWVEYSQKGKVVYPVEYKKVGNTVHFRGLIKDGDSKDIMKGLPKDIRPKRNSFKPSPPMSPIKVTGHDLSFVVQANGFVQARTYSKKYTSIECTYEID